MKKIVNISFIFYKTIIKMVFSVLSLQSGPVCRFQPTCSEYSKEVFEKYGFWYGFWKTLKRIGKCHPWNKGGIDLP